MKSYLFGCCVIISIVLLAVPAFAAVPANINYQGYLTDDSGYPVTGSLDMTFRIYNTSPPQNSIWAEVWNTGTSQVIITDGYYSVQLGSHSPFGTIFEDNADLWLEIVVDGETLSPLKKISSSGYALNAETLDGEDSINFWKKTDSVEADTLDGSDSSAFASASHSHSFSEVTGSVTDAQVPNDITIDFATAAGAVPWSGITGMPSGFSDGTDDTGLTSESDPEVGSNTANQVPYWDGSALVAGNITDLSGDIGIGQTNPQAKLHVAGDVKIEGIIEAQGTGTPIESVPITISSSGYYYLAGNLTSDGTTAITITANNVTLDLNGYTLTGTDTSGEMGIYSALGYNIVIRNGTITNFGSYGIQLLHGPNSRIIGVGIWNNGQTDTVDGLDVDDRSLVMNCVAYNNGNNGITVGPNSIVKNCLSSINGDDGIYAGAGSFVKSCTSSSNDAYGISTSYGCSVINNTAYGNDDDGIKTSGESTIMNNTTSLNGADGIDSGRYSLVKQNTSNNNDNYGFNLHEYCLINDNVAANNNASGSSYTNFEACGTCTFGTNMDGPI